jgi:enoyl-CoA hydratase/carnithine racemase
MTEDARREDSGGVITIKFIRDRKLNAVTRPMLEPLVEAGHDLAGDDRHRVLLITAEGRYFTSGVDISTMDPNMGVGIELTSFPREAMGLAKLAIDAAEHGDRRTARDVDRIEKTLLLSGPEYREKIDALLSRSPVSKSHPNSRPGSYAKSEPSKT